MAALFESPLSLNINPFDSSHQHHVKKITNLMKELVCYNQGELAQYSFFAGEKHKVMKDELNSKSPDKSLVKNYKEELQNYLTQNWKELSKTILNACLNFLRVVLKGFREFVLKLQEEILLLICSGKIIVIT